MLYITHDIASARYFADEVLVMYAGQIVERGPAEDVTQQPAHPYTQLLVSSAPDPDNLGGALRDRAKREHSERERQRRGSASAAQPRVRCSFSPRARSRSTGAALRRRRCCRSRRPGPPRAGGWTSQLLPSMPGAKGVGTLRASSDEPIPGGILGISTGKVKMSVNHLSSRGLIAIAAAGLLAAGLGACSSTNRRAPSARRAQSTTASNTLVMESSPETTITDDFNPFVSTAAPQGMGATGLIYEPLLQFDLAAPPKYYPWLATAYTWCNGGKSITFTIRQGVKWNNGTPMTPADVVFTYDLVKKNAAINLAGLPITSVTSSGNNVTINFSSAQYLNLQQIAGVPILPESVWGSVSNPTTFTDAKPVGTGPYVLKTFTPQGFTLTKNPSYWQASMVKVPNVYFPVYTSNTGALSALYSGAIDWTGNFIPGLQKEFVATSPTYHHFWEAPGSTNALMPNLNKWPTNQLPVRQAISLAVNRSLLASEGEAGLENPVTNTSGITLPTFSAWAGPAASDTVSTSASAAAAERCWRRPATRRTPAASTR